MDCPRCGTENSPGRETCAVCGSPLVDLARISARDRWVGRAIGGAVAGLFIGAVAGALLGLASGLLLGSPVLFVWAGLWLGGISGLALGAAAGMLSRSIHRY